MSIKNSLALCCPSAFLTCYIEFFSLLSPTVCNFCSDVIDDASRLFHKDYILWKNNTTSGRVYLISIFCKNQEKGLLSSKIELTCYRIGERSLC